MGFPFKVAPGLRISTSNHGVRTSIDPHADHARTESDRPEASSSGMGPAEFYASLYGSRRHSSGSRRSVAAARRQLHAAEKAQQAQELAYAFNSIMNLHRASFPPAQSPVAPDAEGKTAADQDTEQETAQGQADGSAQQQHDRLQEQLDHQWSLLCDNDPDLVMSVLGDAFADNEAPAAAVGVDGATVALVVLVPGTEAVPERLPGRTEAGNLSLRKLTKTMRSALYAQLVAGYVLTTIREAFAVAPGLDAARVAAIRTPGHSQFGRAHADCLLAARFSRSTLQEVRWDLVEATTVLTGVSTDLLISRHGVARELQPLDLIGEPELAELLTKVDVEELADGARP